MARIRTIKPEFFRHKRLFELEQESGLPLRLTFAGLWTSADKEGIFKWEPDALKLDCIPWDEVDFVATLEALIQGGFIERYEVNGKLFGCVPSWKDHQVINNREQDSRLPKNPTPVANTVTPVVTRHGNCSDASSDAPLGEGKGREGKGREDAGRGWDEFWNLYPKKTTKAEALKHWKKLKPDADLQATILKALLIENQLRSEAESQGKFFAAPPDAIRWLTKERWRDEHIPAQEQTVACDHPWETFAVTEEFPQKVSGTCGKCGKEVLRERP